jgi:hypothetical protein
MTVILVERAQHPQAENDYQGDGTHLNHAHQEEVVPTPMRFIHSQTREKDLPSMMNIEYIPRKALLSTSMIVVQVRKALLSSMMITMVAFITQ